MRLSTIVILVCLFWIVAKLQWGVVTFLPFVPYAALIVAIIFVFDFIFWEV